MGAELSKEQGSSLLFLLPVGFSLSTAILPTGEQYPYPIGVTL